MNLKLLVLVSSKIKFSIAFGHMVGVGWWNLLLDLVSILSKVQQLFVLIFFQIYRDGSCDLDNQTKHPIHFVEVTLKRFISSSV